MTSTASPPAADARVALRDLTLEHWQVAGGLVEDQQSTAQRYARPLARGVLLVTHRREEVALPGRERRFGAGSALVGGQAYELRAGATT